ncbi:MAG TPA: MBL fold metallo-hydrolase [Syntrophomonadaceae bacterium]|nr:MBL fold metallo-hydrolase [Syntrophomonadaceae bacterium]HOQ09054.1 MBL fold metallo-hydrolase [Syntrophomonadaceae bacterium]HPU49877.1 MBL fold metallo-hydrolase [Syntrophomonadaceae bacterium]
MIETRQYGEVLQIRMSRVFNGQPLYWVAAYLVDGLLIDSGCQHTAQELVDFLSDYHVEQIVNTHYHEDHIAGNWMLHQQRQIPMYAHRDSLPLMRQVPTLYPYQELVWGYPQPVDAQELGPVIKTPRYTFAVLPTPGHCPGHIALLEKEQGWCFSGDLFISERPKVLRPEENVHEIMKSLQYLLNCAPEEFTLFTSMGQIIPKGRQAVTNLLSYLQSVSQQVLELHDSGHSLDDIRQILFGGESRMAEVTNGQFSVNNLIMSVLTHGN